MRKECKMNNRYYAVCGIVEIDGKILFVRHTYGSAKDRILLPGGFVHENELPTAAIEREIFEETGIKVRAKSVFGVQFKPSEWCVVFVVDHVSGEPHSDNYENSEVLLLDAREAIQRSDITNMSRELINSYLQSGSTLSKSDYLPKTMSADEYALFLN